MDSSLYKEKHSNVETLIEESGKLGYISRDLTKRLNMVYPARLDDMIVENYQLIKPCRIFSGWGNNGKVQKFIDNKCNPIDDNDTALKFYLSKNGVLYYRRDNRECHYLKR